MEAIAPSISLIASKTATNQHVLTRGEVQPVHLPDPGSRKSGVIKGISRLAFTPFNSQLKTRNPQLETQLQATIIPAFNAIETSWATTTKIYKRPPVLRFIIGGIPLHRIYSILANPDSSIKLNEKVSPISTYISKSVGIKYGLEGYVLVIRFDRKEATASFLQQRKLVITATTVLKEKVVAEIKSADVRTFDVRTLRTQIVERLHIERRTSARKRRRLKRWPRKLIS